MKIKMPFLFGTKSETLSRLKPIIRHSTILPIYSFTDNDWQRQRVKVLDEIASNFNSNALIVRSSAQNEDGAENSMAGAFESCLNVDISNVDAVSQAVEKVLASFSNCQHKLNQVLVQPMLENINMSGVLMTHDIERGSPYYIVNYDDESGLSDTITGGTSVQKTVLIYREGFHKRLKSKRLLALLNACKELENICDNVPLDIEFGQDNQGVVYIFQVRRITLSKVWHPVTERRVARKLAHIESFIEQLNVPKPWLFGKQTILGVMPDWNPAEIIGTLPRPLASSIYRYLVTKSAWKEARFMMGYREIKNEELMVLIDHHPYIDVRNSFNSFLPQGLSDEVCEKLVNAWLTRLSEHPEYHDKVEFEVAHTCLDFDFEEQFNSRYDNLLNESELSHYREQLCKLTDSLVIGSHKAGLSETLKSVVELSELQKTRNYKFPEPVISNISALFNSCRTQGTKAFAVLARHAFVAESLMRSAVTNQAITQERFQQFKKSIHTVTTNLASTYGKVCQGSETQQDFLATYGHLRPGTYDITSLRYDERADLFNVDVNSFEMPAAEQFSITTQERITLDSLIQSAGFSFNATHLLDYAYQAIAAREYGKFVFTRDLSDALLLLSQWGAVVGLSVDDLSYLELQDVLSQIYQPISDDIDRVLINKVAERKIAYDESRMLKLGHLIASTNDIYVAPLHRSLPNYVTNKCVSGEIVVLNSSTSASIELSGKIVVIEKADPGFDWLFTKSIAGLITQFGGTNSHMAIRCAEFDIPAAIGCGEQLFSKMITGHNLTLNCSNKKIDLMS
jgi:phosphohistidine swiveling domain-containing protein